MTNETVFSKIVDGSIPCDKVYEDDLFLAFNDINPAAKTHIVVIPKSGHLKRLADATNSDTELLGKLMLIISKIAHDLKLDENGYRVITNSGDFAGQEVSHLHFHILGDEKLNHIN